MKLIKERSIAVVFDSVSISKDIVVEGGPLIQNFYAENQSFIPNRFLTPTTLTPKIFITDPNKIIVSGDKHKELLSCEWFENDKKIIDGSDYKIGKDNVLTVLKNSEKDFTISYSAEWLDPRKKQIITIEDSVQFVTIALGDGNIKPRLTLDKAQNWIHNPLKGERVYSIKAYISKDKLYEGAVEWYCTLKGAEKKLIDTSFLFYEGGQYSNELKVNSAYMPDCIITAKNISDNKLKEIYWFFDKHGNPLTYAMPDKTIIEGSNDFSLDEILDELWLENVYTYKVTDGEWELVKVTDIEDYEEWLKTEKTSPYTLAPDGIIFGKYEANTKFLRQFPSSLYVDFITPDRLKEGVTQIKARALVGTKDGVIDRPSRYFKITWLKRALRPGQQDIVIGTGDEIIIDVGEKDAITIEIEDIFYFEIEDLGILKALVNEQGEYLTEENNKILVGR